MERYDIIIFGATGFVGKEVVIYLLDIIKDYHELTWAIAGRCKGKIKMLVKNIENELGINISNVPLIVANVNDYNSLTDMTKFAKVLVNCVGPYTKYGEEVVKACIETKTHCLDISAEINYIDVMAERYHEAAVKADVLIISGCGFASVPADMGVALLQKSFEGKLKLVKSYNQVMLPPTAYIPGIHCVVHSGTWESLIYVLADYHNSKDKYKSTLLNDQNKGSLLHIFNHKLCTPYPGPDEYIIERSQHYLKKTNKTESVAFKSYAMFQWLLVFILIPYFFLIYYLSGINCTRRLLLKYPRIFTVGYFSHKGPTAYVRKNTKFSFDMMGFGEDKDKKSKTLRAVVSGVDPAYKTTAVIFILCAITVVKEYYKMPRGGVTSTAAAFYDTSLIEKLHKNGITYEVST